MNERRPIAASEDERAARNAADRRAKLLSLVSRSADGVFAVDGEQRIVFWSERAEAALRKPAAGMLGERCYRAILGGDYEDPFCRRNCPTIQALHRGEGIENFSISCPRGDAWVSLNVSVIPVLENGAGGPMAIHMFRDVSRRPQSGGRADVAPEAGGRFAAEGDGVEAWGAPYPPPDPSLAPREIEVLQLLAKGLTTKELADRLGVSRVTVRNHIQRLLMKLGVHSRLEAVLSGAHYRLI